MTVTRHNGLVLFELDPVGPSLGADLHVNDVLGDAFSVEADVVVVPASRVAADFFELRSGLAGEVFQKMEQYHCRLVILGDVSAVVAASRSLHDFVYETNRRGHHLFVSDRAEMLARL